MSNKAKKKTFLKPGSKNPVQIIYRYAPETLNSDNREPNYMGLLGMAQIAPPTRLENGEMEVVHPPLPPANPSWKYLEKLIMPSDIKSLPSVVDGSRSSQPSFKPTNSQPIFEPTKSQPILKPTNPSYEPTNSLSESDEPPTHEEPDKLPANKVHADLKPSFQPGPRQLINQPHECHICEIQFIIKTHYTKHLQTHRGDPRVSCCDVCQQVMATDEELKEHMEIHAIGPFKCPKCPKECTTQYNLNMHIGQMHPSREATFKCQICPRMFRTNWGRVQHRRKHAKGFLDNMGDPVSGKSKIRAFKCCYCTKVFNSPMVRRDHQKKHEDGLIDAEEVQEKIHGELESPKKVVLLKKNRQKSPYVREYVCKLCNKVLRCKSVMLEHMDFHKGVKYSCEFCGKEFSYKTSLSLHLQKHYNRWICSICGKSIGSKSMLAKHLRAHEKGTLSSKNGPGGSRIPGVSAAWAPQKLT